MKITYDAGALIAAERSDPLVWAVHLDAISAGESPVVPSAVIWQVWRDGARQALLARLLSGCKIELIDSRLARAAGNCWGGLAGTTALMRSWSCRRRVEAALSTHLILEISESSWSALVR
jgi:hypothetical protein